MKVIALYGHAGCGKTSTLKALYNPDEINLSDTLKEVCNLGYAAFLLTQLNK